MHGCTELQKRNDTRREETENPDSGPAQIPENSDAKSLWTKAGRSRKHHKSAVTDCSASKGF